MAGKILAGLTLVSLLGGCSTMAYQKSDHFDGDKFHNPGMSSDVKSLFAVLKWKLTSKATQWPANIVNKTQSKVASQLNEGEISTTFINHATHLIQVKGVNIITDPVFSERVSPFTWVGPKRVRRPAIELKDLPVIQVVLISHNHYDHMDSASIGDLAKRFDPIFIVPLGNGELIKDMGAKKVIELDWWQSTELVNGNSVTLVPAQHWSRRSMFDTNKALWGGYVVKAADQRQIYFAGDTGYGPHFKAIRTKLGAMDVSIIPIGAYEPRWFMRDQHMNPEDSVQAHLDLESKFSLGTHFGTFQLTDEGVDEPVLALASALAKMNVSTDKFVAPDLGETTFIPALKAGGPKN